VLAEHTLERPDGRVIAVAEWGDPAGLPLISHHGTPASRLLHWKDGSIYGRHGLRRISFDRAGYGRTTRLPGRTMADVVSDVEAIVDALDIARFAVMGASGGAPHALATAALLPDRVIRCMAAVCPAPFDRIDFDPLEGMNAGNVEEMRAAMEGEARHRAVAEREAELSLTQLRAGRADWFGAAYEMAASDHEALAADLEADLADMEEAVGRSVDGWVDDVLAQVRPWGFDVEQIRCPVWLEYGRADQFVPPAHGDWLLAHIPGAIAVVTDAGHMPTEAAIEAAHAWLATGDSHSVRGVG
jgi:pimeloyl-ACP methyl ester carboxylesterase